MSSLEMLTLLELAQGRPVVHGQSRQPGAVAVSSAFRGWRPSGTVPLLLLGLLAVWEAAPRLGLIDPVFLPPFSEVIAAGWQLAQTGELYDDVSRQPAARPERTF